MCRLTVDVLDAKENKAEQGVLEDFEMVSLPPSQLLWWDKHCSASSFRAYSDKTSSDMEKRVLSTKQARARSLKAFEVMVQCAQPSDCFIGTITVNNAHILYKWKCCHPCSLSYSHEIVAVGTLRGWLQSVLAVWLVQVNSVRRLVSVPSWPQVSPTKSGSSKSPRKVGKENEFMPRQLSSSNSFVDGSKELSHSPSRLKKVLCSSPADYLTMIPCHML